MKAKVRRRKNSSLNTVPLVDIIFQLILFFVVSTSFAVIPAVSVQLPKSETTEAVEVSSIIVEVNASNEIFLNGKQVRIQNLGRVLETFEKAPVTLVCDEDVKSGQVMKIFDILRKYGFVQINLRSLEKVDVEG